MPELILVKHSSPEVVHTLPAHRWSLSEEGRLRCKALGARLAVHHPEMIVTSTEPKALETAQIIANLIGRPVAASEELREHDRGNVGFLGAAHFESAVASFFANPQSLVLGRETADEAHGRFANAIARILESYPGCNVIVVTHGTVLALFVARAAGLDPFPLWKRLGLPSFVVLSIPGMSVVAVVENIEEGHGDQP